MPSPDTLTVTINGTLVRVAATATVASVILSSGIVSFGNSVSAEPRGPLCGMGICYGCAAVIDGVETGRTCQTICRDGMNIRTNV